MADSKFSSWSKKNGKGLLGSGVLSTILSGLSVTNKIWGFVGRYQILGHPRLVIYLLEVALTIFALLVWWKPFDTAMNDKTLIVATSKDVISSLRLFRFWWIFLLINWGVAYTLYLIEELLPFFCITAQYKMFPILLVVLSKLEIAAFLGLYLSLSRERATRYWPFIAFVLFLFVVTEILVEITDSRGGIVITSLGGSLLGVALAMFIGRIDSQSFVSPPFILFCCYCYAAIQPMFYLAGENFALLLFSMSLFLKVILLQYVYFLLSTLLINKYIEATHSCAPFTPVF